MIRTVVGPLSAPLAHDLSRVWRAAPKRRRSRPDKHIPSRRPQRVPALRERLKFSALSLRLADHHLLHQRADFVRNAHVGQVELAVDQIGVEALEADRAQLLRLYTGRSIEMKAKL